MFWRKAVWSITLNNGVVRNIMRAGDLEGPERNGADRPYLWMAKLTEVLKSYIRSLDQLKFLTASSVKY